MRRGSVAVSPGELVETGTALGRVGLSGQSNHPHLHLTVLRDGAVVDPFRPGPGPCGESGGALWRHTPPYVKTGLITAGFSTAVPDLAAVRDGSARAAEGAPSLPLVVYGFMQFAQKGDVLTLSAEGPGGALFSHRVLVKTTEASAFQAAGRRPPPEGWPPGAYLGEALLTRRGTVIAHRFAHIEVRP
jgi:hypothetical protein